MRSRFHLRRSRRFRKGARDGVAFIAGLKKAGRKDDEVTREALHEMHVRQSRRSMAMARGEDPDYEDGFAMAQSLWLTCRLYLT